MDLIIEARHIAAAKAAGACANIVARTGMFVSDVPQSELVWFSEKCPKMTAEMELNFFPPIWALSNSGYGDGDGYGSGYVAGYGYGSGYGYGDGYGDGYGSGYGYGQ